MLMSLTIVSLTIAVILCLIYIWYLKVFKKYTRERFAFVGVSATVGLITIFILQVYASQGVLNAIFYVGNSCFDANLRSYQTDVRDHIIVTTVIFSLIYFIYKLHQNWEGPVSTIAAEKKRFKEENNIYEESILQFLDFFRKSQEKKIIPFKEGTVSQRYNVFSSTEYEKAPWHEDVYELFVFRSSQYYIDLEKDFYSEENCFISKFGHNNENIAIMCSIDMPTISAIEKFLKFIFLRNSKYAKIIIAVKNVTFEKYEKIITGKNIEFRCEEELLNTLVDFKNYAQFIKEQYISKPISEGGKITLKDFYVDLNAKSENIGQIDNIENYAINWLQTNFDNKHLALLGEYGCGKSVVSLKLTYELLINQSHSRIPILIELRGKSPRNLSALEILSTWASSFRIEPMALWKLHREGKLLLIFEGFDEMDMVGDREVRFFHFQKLWEFAIPKSKIIITGRPNFFLDDKELKTNLGIDKPFENSHYCEAIYLEKLNKEQIRKALRNVESETRKQVLELLNNKTTNSNFYDLVSRPAILYLVSVIWKERKLSLVKESINSALVIGEFIQYSYSRQTDKKVYFPLTEHEREYFMLGVAVGMQKLTEFSNQISKIDLENVILKLYRDFPEELMPIKNATQQLKNPLKQRLKDNNSAEEMVLTDVRSCGILVNDLSRKDYFKFAHKSFFEYLTSLYFVESVLKENNSNYIMVKSIANTLDISISTFDHSKETVAFTAEILTTKLKLDSSNEENKKHTAQKLFEILYPIKYLSKHPNIAGAIEMFSNARTIPRSMLYFTTIIILFTFSFLVIFRKKSIIENVEIKDSFFENISFMILMTIFMMILFFSTIFKTIGSKRSSIWLKCCNQLDINDDILTKLVSKEYLIFIKGGGEIMSNIPLIIRKYFIKSEDSLSN